MHGGSLDRWEVYCAIRKMLLTDGTRASGFLMRRRVGGVWQYRHLTDAETQEHMENNAW